MSKLSISVLSLTLFLCIDSGTTTFANDEFSKVHLERENETYSLEIKTSAENIKLNLQKAENSILDENIRVTIVDADDEGNPIFRYWTPSASEIEEAKNVYIDENSKATFRISEKEEITGVGVIDGKPILHSEGGYKLGETKIITARADNNLPAGNLFNIAVKLFAGWISNRFPNRFPNRPTNEQVEAATVDPGMKDDSSSKKAIVETVIVCDKEFGDIFNHNYTKILNYWVVYMWDVNMRFKTLPSNDISFRVNGIVVINSTNAQPFIENARESDGHAEFDRILNLYESWVYEHREKFPPHDMIPLVTNTRLEWLGGVAKLNGTCGVDHTNRKSLGTLVFNDGGNWASVTVGAHEMAHSIGALHDDIPNSPYICAGRRFIMRPGSRDDENLRYFFSRCSDSMINNFLRSKSSSCLRTLSSTKPVLDPSFDNPKAPSLQDQCRQIVNNPEAWVQDNDPNSCKTKLCWKRNEDNSTAEVKFVPVDNSECFNGGRCFRGVCRQPGQFFKNVGSELCIKSSDPFSSTGAFIMVQCPTPGTPLDKLLVRQGNYGAMLSSPFIEDTEVGERCGYTVGNVEGNFIWTQKCDVYDQVYGWDFQDVGNNHFLLKHRFTGRCAIPASNNIESLIRTYKACNASDNNMKWERF